MKLHSALLVAAVVFLPTIRASGAEINLRYGAFCDTTCTFTGREHIYIPVSDSDSAPAKQVAEIIRQAARKAGLTMTDSAQVAERMLTFEVRPFSKVIRYDETDPAKSREITDTTFNSIQIHIYDVQRRIEGRVDPIWAGVLNATDSLFNTHLQELLVKLFGLYGKNETRREVFQPVAPH